MPVRVRLSPLGRRTIKSTAAYNRGALGLTTTGYLHFDAINTDTIVETRIRHRFSELTLSSLKSGLSLQTTSLTEMQTGNATPRSITCPFTFLVYTFSADDFKTLCPNSQRSITLAPGKHCPTSP